MGDSIDQARAARELIGRCLSGDAAADRQFQQEYGELIYGYPIRVYRLPAEEAGDFYVFAFDRGRIFRRLRTFEGRAPLRAYLLGFVLDDLVLEWKRGGREIETVSIETLGELPDTQAAANLQMNDSTGGEEHHPNLSELLARVDPGKAVVMKLLYVEDYEFTPTELRHIARLSKRSVRDVVSAVDNLRATVREREAGLKRLEGCHRRRARLDPAL